MNFLPRHVAVTLLLVLCAAHAEPVDGETIGTGSGFDISLSAPAAPEPQPPVGDVQDPDGDPVEVPEPNAPIVLTNEAGASLVFEENAEALGTWRWTWFQAPGSAEPRSVKFRTTPFTASGVEAELSPMLWSLAEHNERRVVLEQTSEAAGMRFRRVFTLSSSASVAKMETWAQAIQGSRVLERAGLLDLRVADESFQETGSAPASFPLFGRDFFFGIEHVSGVAQADDNAVHLWQTPHVRVDENWHFLSTVIAGWAVDLDCTLVSQDERIRYSFHRYLDTIRIKPADFELHTNTWWSLPLPFSEADVLKHITALSQGFTSRTGTFFDSFALDLGWSDVRSIWRIDGRRFPNGFRTINERLQGLGSRLGIWVSPGSAYPEGLDNSWLEAAGYEVAPFAFADEKLKKTACFALGGRYQREFRENLVSLVSTYGIRHVKLDYMAHQCDVPSHGHPTGFDSAHAIDAGLADVLDSLRAVNPNIVLEPLCTGYPPSPWWTAKTPYVLGPYGDDVPHGRVPSPAWMESLITARDIAYRRDADRWIMPTQAMETIDLVMQSPGDFENLAVMAIGRGRWFISTYLKPELMTARNWDFLDALVRWARANKQYLGHARMIGGNVEAREAYGYMFHNTGKDIYCLRNPWMEQQALEIPLCTSEAARELQMIYPRRQLIARLEPGDTSPRVLLAPYETVMLETVPAPEVAVAEPVVESNPVVTVSESQPTVWITPASGKLGTKLAYTWQGTLNVPADVVSAELCVLVEGDASVSGSTASIVLDGRNAGVSAVGSNGQFAASSASAPEHWKWFIVPLAPGSRHVALDMLVPTGTASIGVFVRGSTRTTNDPAPADGAVFPVYHPELRHWSQTVVPLRLHPDTPIEESGS